MPREVPKPSVLVDQLNTEIQRLVHVIIVVDLYLLTKALVLVAGADVTILSSEFTDDPAVILSSGILGYLLISVGSTYLRAVDAVQGRESGDWCSDEYVSVPATGQYEYDVFVGTGIVVLGLSFLFGGFVFLFT